MSFRGARAWIRLTAGFVPGSRRDEWREEWLAEIDALEVAHSTGAAGLPSALGFAVGALPHALWMRTEGWTMDGIRQDLKFALRMMRRSPGFTLVAALTLALGIGANASIFSLVNGLMFRAPAGIHQPERLVQLARSYETDPRWDNFSWPALRLIDAEAEALSGVAGYSGQIFALGLGADTERVIGQEVTGNYFGLLGVRPHLGRLLQPTDDVDPGAHAVVVLSHSLWTNHYGADPSIVGRTIPVGSVPYEVVGVAPPGFAGVDAIGTPPAIWVPTMQTPGYHGDLPFEEWGWSWIQLFGRLQDGVTFEQARASMDVVSARLREAAPVNAEILVLMERGVGLDPDGRRQARTLTAILGLIVAMVLLVTCTNVANLFLARAAGRRTEVGVRRALGAGRGRLMQQLIAESLALAALATLLAIPVVMSADRFLPLLVPYSLSVSVGADARVLLFLGAVGMATGLLFGAAPAWATTRRDLAATLREAGTTGGPGRSRLSDGLVVAQLGLSLGLVAAAALLGRSVVNASSADPGFEPDGLAIAVLDVQATGRYDDAASIDLLDRIVRSVEGVPGVSHVTVANQTPIAGGHSRGTVRPAGRDDVEYEAESVVVGPSYFETMGIPIVRGRALGGFREEPEGSVVISEGLAAMFWPGEDPIGKELAGNPNRRVVGLVPDVQIRSLRVPGRPAVYYPAEHASPVMILHARSRTGPMPDAAAIQAAVASVDPGMPVSVTRLRDAIGSSMSETRTIGLLVAAFAGLALVLAAVGLYGVVSFAASQRVREIGIRIALGARPESLVRLVLGRGLGIALLGVVAGLIVAFGLGRALQGLLFGVEATDALTLSMAALALMVTAGFAAWLPARRASRVDPAASLRNE